MRHWKFVAGITTLLGALCSSGLAAVPAGDLRAMIATRATRSTESSVAKLEQPSVAAVSPVTVGAADGTDVYLGDFNPFVKSPHMPTDEELAGGGIAGTQPYDDCGTAPLITCGSTTQVDLTTTDTLTGDPTYSCHFGGAAQGVGTAWFRFVASGPTATVRTCASTGAADDSLLAIYSGTCTSLVEIACNDDACGASGFLSEVTATGLTNGTTYYIQISCFAAGDRGIYTMELTCGAACDVICDGADIRENEANCGLPADTIDGGCNSTPNIWFPIQCGQTICGTAAATTTTRDTDWYEITLTQTTRLTWSVTAEFPVLVAIIQPGPTTPCTGIAVRASATAAPCAQASINFCCAPGRWWLFVGRNGFVDMPCGAEYRGVLQCAPCTEPTGACCRGAATGTPTCTAQTQTTCVNTGGVYYGDGVLCSAVTCADVDCPPGALLEGEPDCGPGYVDAFNGGCNSAGQDAPLINCGDVICGETGMYNNNTARDTDWWTLPISEPTQVTWSVTGETIMTVILIRPGDPGNECAGLTIVDAATALAGETAQVSACLDVPPSGFYWVFASCSDAAGGFPDFGVACGTRYLADLVCGPCPRGACCLIDGSCVENISGPDCFSQGGVYQGDGSVCSTVVCCTPCPPDAIDEGELDCGQPDDITNGGCNSTPPIFTTIECGARICGTIGTAGGIRDTDWYELVLSEQTFVVWSATAQFDALVGIVNNGGVPDCAGVTGFLAFDTPVACTPGTTVACLEAGTYWFFVSSLGFDGVPCGAQYFAELTCQPCPEPCDIPACPPGAAQENEANCGLPDDTTNGGCNSDPAVFTPIACNQTVCGTGSYSAESGARDTDWFEFTLTEQTFVTFVVNAEFQSLIGLIDNGGVPTCTGNETFIAADLLPQCTEGFVFATLPAGTWWAFVAPDFFINVPCDAQASQYQATLLCGPASCSLTCAPGATPEGEPDCGDDYDDLTNGGCNSTPVVFQEISCGDRICGESGTFLAGAANTRDTDWYRLVLTATSDVTWRVRAEFPVTTFILTADPGVDPCGPALAVNAIGVAAACEQLDLTATALPAGTYLLFVAPAEFTGVACGAEYEAEVVCGAGNPCAGSILGDANCDGLVDNGDIDCFVQGLLDLSGGAWQACALANNPSCTADYTCTLDLNHDTVVDNGDIDAFVACLIALPAPGDPCP